jgi:hypothetical protein
MPAIVISLILLLLTITPVKAQSATQSATPSGSVNGVFDDETTATLSASPSATPRAVTYLDTTNTPTSGAVENTLAFLAVGIILIYSGYRLQRS